MYTFKFIVYKYVCDLKPPSMVHLYRTSEVIRNSIFWLIDDLAYRPELHISGDGMKERGTLYNKKFVDNVTFL